MTYLLASYNNRDFYRPPLLYRIEGRVQAFPLRGAFSIVVLHASY